MHLALVGVIGARTHSTDGKFPLGARKPSIEKY